MIHDFWEYLQQLTDTSQIIIDRLKGSTHQGYPDRQYPGDYGFLDGTTSIDTRELDIWVGSLSEKKVVGALCTVDLLKRDTELNMLYGCTYDDIQAIYKSCQH